MIRDGTDEDAAPERRDNPSTSAAEADESHTTRAASEADTTPAAP